MDFINTGTKINSAKSARYSPSYNAVQINMQKPTVNAPAPSGIYDYPQADGQIYYPPVQINPVQFGQNHAENRTPSGVEDYDNYSEIDSTGQEVASVKYSKEGNSIVQSIKTKSPDGTTLEKTLKNSPNFKHSNIVIKDNDGKILLSKDKTYEKIDDDSAKTVTNGEVYNISGLKGDVINVEHNGNTVVLDLNKMLNPDVKPLKMGVSPEEFPIREEKITDEEKAKLFDRIKSLSGDDLIRLSKSVKTLQFLDEKSIESFFVEDGKTLLLSPKDWENTHLVTEHELGHAINHKNTTTLLSSDDTFSQVREYEKQNYKQYSDMTLKGDKLLGSKFLFGNPDFDWKDSVDDTEGYESNLRDETFAECYNNLNTMDIMHYDEEVMPMRTLAMFKYMPKTMVETERLSQI